MRSSTHQRSPRSESSFPWIWVIIIGAIFGIILLNSIFSGKTTTSTGGSFLTVSPGSGSEVYIKPASGSSKQITDVEDLYTTDTSLSISNGFAHVASTFIDGYLDKSSEMVYTAHATDGEKIEFTRGRLWIESHGNNIVQMKNIDITLKDGDIVMAEQPNQIFSTLYVLRGNIMISAGTMTSTLSAGKKIMVSKSDLANPGITLEKLSGAIDDTIKQNPLYILRNGNSILTESSSTSSQTNSGSTTIVNTVTGGVIAPASTKYIEITSPFDQSEITKSTIDIIGKTFSKDIKRITINDVDAIVSPVDESFSLKGIAVTSDIVNLVYKVYARDTTLLDRGVLTLYPKNRQSGADKLTPNNFPINDKDYRVLSPTDNPFITTDTSVTVSGTVPKNTVQYIMVNNYRLKKFIANSSSWYYYANMDYDTMKDGINLYEIGFYGSSDQLLFKQLFTIVKEKKGSISGELIQ